MFGQIYLKSHSICEIADLETRKRAFRFVYIHNGEGTSIRDTADSKRN